MRVRIAILVERVGPYHQARFRALSRALGPGRLKVIEVAGGSARYGWEAVPAEGFEVGRLFPTSDYASIPKTRLRDAVRRALEAASAEAVALNGWGFAEARAAHRWCRSTGTPTVLMSDSQERDRRRWLPVELVKRRYVRTCDTAFVAGARHAAYIEKLGLSADRVVRGYDVVDNEHFARGADRARSVENERFRLGLAPRYWLACSRFVPEKNLRGLLHAYARFRARAPDRSWHLVILGDGPLKGELTAAARELGILSSVKFPGFVQYAELPMFYGLASALVLPSLVEPWGLVVNEGMASGLPVLVSAHCGCVPELVRDGENGHSFDPRDLDGLAELMVRLSRSTQLAQMGDSSRRIIQGFTPESFAENMKRAIDIAISHRQAVRAIPAGASA